MFFKYKFCQPRKLIHAKLLEIDHPQKYINVKNFDFGISKNKSTRKLISLRYKKKGFQELRKMILRQRGISSTTFLLKKYSTLSIYNAIYKQVSINKYSWLI